MHCCVEHVDAQLNTASHSGSLEQARPWEQHDDLRHDEHVVSDAVALQVFTETPVPPLVPTVPLVPPLVVVDPLVPLVPLVPPLVPPRGPPLVPVPVVVPLHAADATTTAIPAKAVTRNATADTAEGERGREIDEKYGMYPFF